MVISHDRFANERQESLVIARAVLSRNELEGITPSEIKSAARIVLLKSPCEKLPENDQLSRGLFTEALLRSEVVFSDKKITENSLNKFIEKISSYGSILQTLDALSLHSQKNDYEVKLTPDIQSGFSTNTLILKKFKDQGFKLIRRNRNFLNKEKDTEITCINIESELKFLINKEVDLQNIADCYEALKQTLEYLSKDRKRLPNTTFLNGNDANPVVVVRSICADIFEEDIARKQFIISQLNDPLEHFHNICMTLYSSELKTPNKLDYRYMSYEFDVREKIIEKALKQESIELFSDFVNFPTLIDDSPKLEKMLVKAINSTDDKISTNAMILSYGLKSSLINEAIQDRITSSTNYQLITNGLLVLAVNGNKQLNKDFKLELGINSKQSPFDIIKSINNDSGYIALAKLAFTVNSPFTKDIVKNWAENGCICDKNNIVQSYFIGLIDCIHANIEESSVMIHATMMSRTLDPVYELTKEPGKYNKIRFFKNNDGEKDELQDLRHNPKNQNRTLRFIFSEQETLSKNYHPHFVFASTELPYLKE